LSGCIPFDCTQPVDITGFSVTNDDLRAASFDVTAVCATGYYGTSPVAVVCTAAGEYTLAGSCVPFSCTRPVDTTGYTVTEVSLVAIALVVTGDCDVGFASNSPLSSAPAEPVQVESCTVANGSYTLSGCINTTIECSTPLAAVQSNNATADSGYSVTERSLLAATFDVTPVCYEGFLGTPVVTACITHGAAYTLSGCMKFGGVCKRPVHTLQNCIRGKPGVCPDTHGYVLTETSLPATTFDVTAVCAQGYAGNPYLTSCSARDFYYKIRGCLPFNCTQPADITGYTVINDDLRAATFDVTTLCAAGYDGTAVAAVCNAAGEYMLSGCFPFNCATVSDVRVLGGQTMPELAGSRGDCEIEATGFVWRRCTDLGATDADGQRVGALDIPELSNKSTCEWIATGNQWQPAVPAKCVNNDGQSPDFEHTNEAGCEIAATGNTWYSTTWLTQFGGKIKMGDLKTLYPDLVPTSARCVKQIYRSQLGDSVYAYKCIPYGDAQRSVCGGRCTDRTRTFKNCPRTKQVMNDCTFADCRPKYFEYGNGTLEDTPVDFRCWDSCRPITQSLQCPHFSGGVTGLSVDTLIAGARGSEWGRMQRLSLTPAEMDARRDQLTSLIDGYALGCDQLYGPLTRHLFQMHFCRVFRRV
jgi:hypothetical protein